MDRLTWIKSLDQQARAAGGRGLKPEILNSLDSYSYEQVGEMAEALQRQVPPTPGQKVVLSRMGVFAESKKEAGDLIAASKRGDRAVVDEHRKKSEAAQLLKHRQEVQARLDAADAEGERIRLEVLAEGARLQRESQDSTFIAKHPELQQPTPIPEATSPDYVQPDHDPEFEALLLAMTDD